MASLGNEYTLISPNSRDWQVHFPLPLLEAPHPEALQRCYVSEVPLKKMCLLFKILVHQFLQKYKGWILGLGHSTV